MSPQTSFETLSCALLYLLSRHARQPEPHLPVMIREHLEWLADHPDGGRFPALQDTFARLARQWQPGARGVESAIAALMPAYPGPELH